MGRGGVKKGDYIHGSNKYSKIRGGLSEKKLFELTSKLKFKYLGYYSWGGSSQTVPSLSGLKTGKGYLIHSRHALNFRSGVLSLSYLPWSSDTCATRIDISTSADGANGWVQSVQYVVPKGPNIRGTEAGYWSFYLYEIDIVEKEE